MTDLGDELRRVLAGRGISLREAARRAGCSPGYLSNVAHGRKALTPAVAARLDRELGTGDRFAEYALRPRGSAEARSGEGTDSRPHHMSPDDRALRDGRQARTVATPHRDLPPLPSWAVTLAEAKRDAALLWGCDLDENRTPAGGGTEVASAVLNWLTALPDDTATRAAARYEVGPHDVERVRAVRAMLKALDNAHGGGVAFPMAAAYLRGEAAILLRGSCDEATRAALLTAVAVAELDAGWSAYDAGDHGLARAYMLHALRMAHAARSRLLGARIVCALSHQALHLGQARLSVDLARAGRARAAADATPRAVAMLAAMEAMAQAGAREADRCKQALDDAERALASAAADDGDPDWLDFDEGGLLGHAARALRDLAAAGLAAPGVAGNYAMRSAELCQAGHGRTRAQRNAILATTFLQAGEIDRAAAIGEQVIANARSLRSRHVERDVAALLASIGPTRSRAACGFTEQAREFLAARRLAAAPGHGPAHVSRW